MKKRTLAILLAALLALALLSGCGRSASSASYSAADSRDYYEPYYEPAPFEAAYDDYDYAYEGDYWAEESAGVEAVNLSSEIPSSIPDSAKLIYIADLDMETMEFDEALSALSALTAEVGGYYESSSVSESGSTRRASYTVRVPAGSYRMFVDQAGELCHLLSLNESTEDVSEEYYDTAGRLETQQTKLSRLQALLAEAENMEDIITIENAISETEELIDRLSGTLRHYDALVDYSTVYIYIREVKVYEPEPDPTYGTRLGAAFTSGLEGFAEGLGDILVALAYSWLWLLLIAGIIVLILWLTRKRRAAKKEERAAKKEEREARKSRLQQTAVEPVRYSVPSAEEEKRED